MLTSGPENHEGKICLIHRVLFTGKLRTSEFNGGDLKVQWRLSLIRSLAPQFSVNPNALVPQLSLGGLVR